MAAPQPDSQSQPPAADAEPAVDANVMDKVLQETLSAAGEDEPLNRAELGVLLEVARRYPKQPLSLEPITIELVQSILLQRFGEQLRSSRNWKEMPREIAGTLWDSPDSHDRLQRLWAHLAETESCS